MKKEEIEKLKKDKDFIKFYDSFKPKDVVFVVSEFEELMLQDIYMSDENTKMKLNRNVTDKFFKELELYYNTKRNIRYNIKGETRDGKSYVGLKIVELIISRNGHDFNEMLEYFVCGNQIEYRQKLQSANFGDFFLVDENYFTRAGLGANIETSQLTDYNNIIAKKNIGSIFITPRKFLNTGAVLGFSTYGRDSKNWITRLLVFKFKDDFPYLVGYIAVDIGELFRKYGCFVYNDVGGCANPNEKEFKDIDKERIKYSWAVPKKYKENYKLLSPTIERKEKDNTILNCPFYNICNHGMSKYERKKDTWIEKELKGGLDERTHERFRLACLLILDLNPVIIVENNLIKVNAKNGKDLKNRVRLKVHAHTNTKMGIAEFDELLEIIKSNTDLSMLCETLYLLELDEMREKYFKLENGELIKTQYNSLVKRKKELEKEKEERNTSKK